MRPLASARHSGGTITLTREGIDSIDSHEAQHIAWQDCLAAVWDPPRLTVTVHTDGSTRQYAWLLDEPGLVPAVVRDRVGSVVLCDLRRDFADHGAVRFIGRRRGDAVHWLTLADDTVWAQSEQGRRSIAAELVDLRSTLGV